MDNSVTGPIVEVDEEISDSEDEGEHQQPKFIDNNKDVTAEVCHNFTIYINYKSKHTSRQMYIQL